MFIKYSNEEAFGESKDEEQDIREEFTRQRKFLEQTIINLKKHIKTCIQKKDSYTKITEENRVLIREINKLRQEQKIKYKTHENVDSNFKTKKGKNSNIKQVIKCNQKPEANIDDVEKHIIVSQNKV